MPLPLFPANDAPVLMRQGAVGNCYMLAALDCILNAGPEGYRLVKSLFTETTDNITVRLKHSVQSAHIKPHMLAGKYTYYYDMSRNEDVFILGREKIFEIESSMAGVTTNSLAVRILERLFSYYYEPAWDSFAPMASVIAHNIPIRRYQGTSSAFVSKLLGIKIHESFDIDEIIKLKTICPEQPVYVSMSYGVADAFGQIHTRHALRIDKIIPKPGHPGEYDFILVNPWNNQKSETFSSAEIGTKNCRFCTYIINPEQHELTRMLLNLSVPQAQYVFAQPVLDRKSVV